MKLLPVGFGIFFYVSPAILVNALALVYWRLRPNPAIEGGTA